MEETMDVRYPDITVQLTGEDGNAFAVMGAVKKALMRNGVSKEDRELFVEQAMSGDYDNLLCVCMEWVEVK
jgi:hypothetical protein